MDSRYDRVPIGGRVTKEGEIAEVSYLYPRPGADKTPVAKVGFVTRIGDQVCVVGYYK